MDTLENAIIRMRAMPDHLNLHSLSRDEVLAVLAALDKRGTAKEPIEPDEDPETYRREKPTLDASPIADCPYDYGHAGTMIDRAVHHLDEGLPNGQRKRCAVAFAMLRRGVHEMETWMQAKGYFKE